MRSRLTVCGVGSEGGRAMSIVPAWGRLAGGTSRGRRAHRLGRRRLCAADAARRLQHAGSRVMLLDIRTTIAIAAGLGLLMALSLRYVLRDYPAMLGPSMREWMVGIGVQAVSWA